MRKATDAQLGRTAAAYAEAVALAAEGKLDAWLLERALRNCINELDQDGPIQHSRAFLAAVSREAVDTVEEDPDLALRLLKQSSLSPREERIMRLRYGMEGGDYWSLDRLARKYAVTRERIRQTESKTLAKIRHPSNRRSDNEA